MLERGAGHVSEAPFAPSEEDARPPDPVRFPVGSATAITRPARSRDARALAARFSDPYYRPSSVKELRGKPYPTRRP